MAELLAYFGLVLHLDVIAIKKDRANPIMLPVPQGDKFMDPYATGNVTFKYFPTIIDENGTMFNTYTSYLDLSGLYGYSTEVAADMRLFKDGLLQFTVNEIGEFPLRLVDSEGNLGNFKLGNRFANSVPVSRIANHDYYSLLYAFSSVFL